MSRITLSIIAVALPLVASADPLIQTTMPEKLATFGGSVAVMGTGFGPQGATVTLGGAPCPVMEQTDKSLVCHYPAGVGTNHALVVTAGGTVSSPVAKDYNPPTVSTVAPATAVGGEVVTISGSDFGGAGAVVTVRGQPCVVDSQTHHTITCRLPAGAGVGNDLVVSVGGQSSTPLSFSYGPPRISGLSPALVGTAGGTISIAGAGFGAFGATVTVGGASCPVTDQSDTTLLCTVEAGVGAGLMVVVSSGGQSSAPASVGYAPPAVDEIAPQIATADELIVVTGTNFGEAGATVDIGGQPCPVLSQSHGQLKCVVPAGSGTQQPLVVTVAGQASAPADFAYSAPLIGKITPGMVPSAGAAITISGRGFGVSGAAVTIDGEPCSVTQQSDTSLQCVAPAGTGTMRPVLVTAGGQTSAPSPLSTVGPTLAAVGPGGVVGGDSLVLSGQNFGLTGAKVWVGGQACVVTAQNHVHITCTLPAGTGGDHAVLVMIDGQTAAPLSFSYGAPVIAAIQPSEVDTTGGVILITGKGFGPSGATVDVAGESCDVVEQTDSTVLCSLPAGAGANHPVTVAASGLVSAAHAVSYGPPAITSVLPGKAVGGATLTILGENFGSEDAEVTVSGKTCQLLSQTHDAITCTLPAGSGAGHPVTVSVAGQTSNAQVIDYGAPKLLEISPSAIPTSGGEVTVAGAGFGEAGAQVTISGKVCELVAQTDTSIQCVMGAGVGQKHPVVITAGGQASSVGHISYMGPGVEKLISFGGTPGDDLAIIGVNFGAAGATVTVGGAPCPVSDQNHTQITCTLPQGSGSEVEVMVSVGGQSAEPALFAFAPATVQSFSPTYLPTTGGHLTLTGSGFGFDGASVTVGPHACAVTSQTPTSITCNLPGGAGKDHPVKVSIAGQTQAAGTFSYQWPALQAISPVGATAGQHITLTGSNFGSSGAKVTVGDLACPVVSQSHTQVTCTLPAGVGLKQAVIVTVAGQSSGSLGWDYPAPAVAGVQPATVPTPGALVTISGSSFGGSATATVGGKPCKMVIGTDTQLFCLAPAGVGTGHVVAVTAGGQKSAKSSTVSYDPPTIMSVGPAGAVAGGELTVTGANFGTSGAQVTVGGATCALTSQTHASVTCILPAGVGQGHDVVVAVGGQKSKAASFAYGGPKVAIISPASAPTAGGASLTLSGAGFGAKAGTVSVGGVDCPVNTWSASSVTCTLAAGAGAYKAVVVTVAGETTQVGVFSYDPPSVERVLPGALRPEGGRVVTIVGQNFGVQGADVSVGGAVCAVTEQSDAAVHCVAPTLSLGLVDLVVSLAGQSSEPMALPVMEAGCGVGDDGLACDSGSACGVGVCQVGACVADWSAPDWTACHDGSICSVAGTCQAGVCSWSGAANNGAQCDDGSACTIDDTCAAGSCVGAAVVCDDDNPCTADSCNGDGDCIAEPQKGAACDDGAACTAGDSCQADGSCAGQAFGCDDGNPCTADVCDGDGGCVSTPTLGACDDGQPCTMNDTCTAAGCSGVPYSCDDGDACTDAVCVGDGNCMVAWNQADCDDDDPCTEGDYCADGDCAGEPLFCDDADPCTADTCADGACENTPLDCSDGGCPDGCSDACEGDDCDAPVEEEDPPLVEEDPPAEDPPSMEAEPPSMEGQDPPAVDEQPTEAEEPPAEEQADAADPVANSRIAASCTSGGGPVPGFGSLILLALMLGLVAYVRRHRTLKAQRARPVRRSR